MRVRFPDSLPTIKIDRRMVRLTCVCQVAWRFGRIFFEKSLEHSKDVYTCFVDLGEVCDRLPREKLWRRGCGSTVWTSASFWTSSNSLPAQKMVSVSTGVKSQPLSVVVGLRQWCVVSLRPAGQIRPDYGQIRPNYGPRAKSDLTTAKSDQTTARGPNPTCESISPGSKTHFANNNKK